MRTGVKPKNLRGMGDTQREVLRCLIEYKSWHDPCGWVWASTSTTVRILDSLVKRGLAERDDQGRYTPTEAGVTCATE